MCASAINTHLKTIPYFNSLNAEALQDIAERALLRTYGLNQVLFIEDEPAEGLWIVEQGTVKIFKLNQLGDEHILRLAGRGTTFNDIGAFDGGLNPANASALSPTVETWLIPSDVITEMLMRHPHIALRVVQIMARRVRTLVGQIEELALYSVKARLARFLLKQLDDPNLSGPGVTRTAIAAHLNTTPQTISVILRELEAAEAIAFNRHRITVIDEEKLRRLALL